MIQARQRVRTAASVVATRHGSRPCTATFSSRIVGSATRQSTSGRRRCEDRSIDEVVGPCRTRGASPDRRNHGTTTTGRPDDRFACCAAPARLGLCRRVALPSPSFLPFFRAFLSHAPWPSRRSHDCIALCGARRCVVLDRPAARPDVASGSGHPGSRRVPDLPRGPRDDSRRVDPPGPLASYVTHGFLHPRWSGWADEQRRGSDSPLNRHPACP